jgi:hypothetical protein
MVIGYVENYIGNDKIMLTFYRKKSLVNKYTYAVIERWILSHKLKVHKDKREFHLDKLLNSGVTLQPLARGT